MGDLKYAPNSFAVIAIIFFIYMKTPSQPFGSWEQSAMFVIGQMVMFVWVRWMVPRFRYDQLMDLGWRRFIPLALANIVVTALILWWRAGA